MNTNSLNVRRRKLLAVAAGLSFAPFFSGLRAEQSPKKFADLIIMIPGITGSVLQLNKRDVWSLSADGIGNAIATLGASVKELYLAEDPQDVDDLGDGVRATGLFPDVHLIPGLWKIDGYSSVRAAISQRVSLQVGLNFIEFPYDWRRDNRVAARRLAKLAPEWLARWQRYSGNPEAKLVLVAHSMGGVISRYYLECLEGWRLTRKLITFGTPYRGALNALDFLSNGYVKSFGRLKLADLSELMRSFTSVYQLLPRYPCVDMGDGILRRPGEVVGLPNVDSKRAAAALGFHREMERAICSNQISSDYRAYDIHTVAGVGQLTKQAAHLKAGKLSLLNSLNGNDESGDGTVPKPSAIPLGCKVEEDDRYDNSALFVPGLHGSLQNLPQVMAQVSHVLTAPDFTEYREVRSGRMLALEVDDVYSEQEPVSVNCCGGPNTFSGMLLIEDTVSKRVVRQTGLSLVPEQSISVTLNPLQPGTYRATLATGERYISDVFLVSK